MQACFFMCGADYVTQQTGTHEFPLMCITIEALAAQLLRQLRESATGSAPFERAVSGNSA